MRHRLAFAVLSLACASALPVIPACSSNNSAADNGDSGDAGIPPNQLVGQPCDPTLPVPCAAAPATDYGCFTVACVVGICVESESLGGCVTGDNEDVTFFEGGSVNDDAGIVTCASSEDCPSRPATDASPAVTLVCGFSAFDQCVTTGYCVTADPPYLHDGAVETACGCNGQPVSYVNDDLTSAPVESPSPCAAIGQGADAGSDAEPDAPFDAATDAGAEPDADAGAGTDAGPAPDADAAPVADGAPLDSALDSEPN